LLNQPGKYQTHSFCKENHTTIPIFIWHLGQSLDHGGQSV